LEFSHKNPRLFSTCSTDKTVRIWDTSISKTHKRIDTKEQNYFLTFSPDDSYIVVVGKSGNSSTISAIDVRSEIADYKSVLKEEIFKVVFHPSGKYLFLTAENGKLIILE
jgi:WD40 repeat protein